MVGVVGKAIKGFGKALKRNKASKQVFDHVKGKPFPKSTQKHMYQSAIRRKAMKQAGYKQEPYIPSGKKSKTGARKLKEMWSYDPHKMPKKGINYKKIAIKTAPIGAAAAAGESYGRHREKRKGKK